MNPLHTEALRYLGSPDTGDESIHAVLSLCFAALEGAKPRHIYRVLPAADVLARFDSASLSAHLRGCQEAALFAATLGTQADTLIRRGMVEDTFRGAAFHACAAAKLEAYADDCQAALPFPTGMRFSPGYGDFALHHQGALLSLLDGGRSLGLYLTAGDLLVPTKSITAVIPIGGEQRPSGGCHSQDQCTKCGKRDCPFRRTT